MNSRVDKLAHLRSDYRVPFAYQEQAKVLLQGQALDAIDQHLDQTMREGRALLLLGCSGNGKTFALWYALVSLGFWFSGLSDADFETYRHRYGLGGTGVYDYRIVAKDRLERQATFHDTIEQLRALAFDEIGAETESRSGWSTETFELLVDYRCSRRLPTFMASNLTVEEFKNRYGGRVANRFREWATVIELTQTSFRQPSNTAIRPAVEPEPHIAVPMPAAMRDLIAAKPLPVHIGTGDAEAERSRQLAEIAAAGLL